YAIYLFASILATATHFVWIAYSMKRAHGLSSMQMLAASHLVSAALLYPLLKTPATAIFTQPALLSAIALVGLLMWLARMLYYYAYSQTDVGEVAIFSSLTPVYGLIFSLLAGYAIAPQAMLGIVLICASIYAYFCHQRYGSATHPLLSPIITITQSRPLRYALFSTFPPALAIVFHKQAVGLSDPVMVSFWICLIIGVLTALALFARGKYRILRVGRGDAFCLLVAGILQTAMTLSISCFLQLAHPAAAQALLRLAIVLQIFMAWYFLNERFNLRQHLLSSAIAIIGSYLILSAETP
ncbi:MAG: DMT family transporter, partial [Rickettsiales bacterium]|nr:DMT family transporter [Rickettsiales bacterium]